MKTGIEIIAEERQRQIDVEGWTPEHDSHHTSGELADAAATYAMTKESRAFLQKIAKDFFEYKEESTTPTIWPWDAEWYKPTPDDRVRELAKAGALIAAEIDRLNRIKEKIENK